MEKAVGVQGFDEWKVDLDEQCRWWFTWPYG